MAEMISKRNEIFVFLLLASTTWSCLSKSVEKDFVENFHDFNQVALLIQDSFSNVSSFEITGDSLLLIFKDRNKKQMYAKTHSNPMIESLTGLLINNNLSYIFNREDKIIFEYRKSCFDAIYFYEGNSEYAAILSRFDDWYKTYGDHWILEKGECYSID